MNACFLGKEEGLLDIFWSGYGQLEAIVQREWDEGEPGIHNVLRRSLVGTEQPKQVGLRCLMNPAGIFPPFSGKSPIEAG